MYLHLKNIGKLSEANVELNGITVIAGENNTGKSTVGRVLYSLFNSFYNFEEQIKNTRISLFSQAIEREFDDKYDDFNIDALNIAKHLFKISYDKVNIDYILTLINNNVDILQGFIIDEDENGNIINVPNDEFKASPEFLSFVIDNYQRFYKEIPDESIYASIFNRQIRTMFHSQLNNFSSNEKGYISLKIKNKTVEMTIENNQVKSIKDTLSLKTEILYLDNPFILDEWMLYTVPRNPTSRSGIFSYRNKLLQSLMSDGSAGEVEEAFKELVVNERIKHILSIINSACSGSLSFKPREGFFYNADNFGENNNIHINNISTGLKTFIIIKSLITNGSLEDNGAIILDEPEIHLHPEWQVLFAEIIVLLQKEFNLHILINTHSPYFLRAIEVFSAKNNIADRCKYYLAENVENTSIISDVTTFTDAIYTKLSSPLENLQIMEHDDD